jgi:hypothetical protein
MLARQIHYHLSHSISPKYTGLARFPHPVYEQSWLCSEVSIKSEKDRAGRGIFPKAARQQSA